MPFIISSLYPPTPITTGDEAELTIRLTAYDPSPSPNVQENIPRLTADDEEIRIRAVGWGQRLGAIGKDCNFTLADINDRSFITADSEITFEIDVKRGGVLIETKTIAHLQKLSQRSFSISGDNFSFGSISGVTDKLSLSPAVPFIIYDPDKVPFDAAAVEKLYDTEGREYAVEAISFPGLMLYDLFQEIFVNRCGFTSYWTNVENYPINQLAVDITETYLGALNQWIEPFSDLDDEGPLLVESDGELRILDTSLLIPEGFPAPRDLTIFGCSEASLNAAYSDVAAVKMVYSVSDRWDFSTNRIEVSDTPIGNEGSAILQRLLIENYIQLRSHAVPDIVQDEQLQFVWEYVRAGIVDVSQDVEEHFFDRYARPSTSRFRRWSRLPDGSSPNAIIGLDPDEEEIQTMVYAQHPQQVGRQFQKSIRREVSGRVMVDSDNPYLGEPFRQDLKLAHWAGNANEGIEVEQGDLRTYEESVHPQRNGQVTRKVFNYDHARNVPLVKRREPQVADVSLNGDNTQTRWLLVTEDGSEYTGGRVVTIYVGPIPLEIAIPLVRRKLRRMRSLPQKATLSLLGFDPTVEAGMTFAASDKAWNLEGNFICTAYSGSGQITDGGAFAFQMSVEGTEI